MESIRGIAKILCKGFIRTLSGTAISATIAMSVCGYVSIPSESGYIAVCDFIVATATLCVAIGCMYAIGGKKRKGGYEK